jgi:hypothetical protein
MRKLVVLLTLFSSFPLVQAQWKAEVESGLVFQGYNDVRIPNETGTTFSFSEDFDLQGVPVPLRLRLHYTYELRNHFSVLIAPLSIRYEGPAPFAIRFQDAVFSEGDLIDGLYRFNSYRITYRRDLLDTEFWTLGLGFTAKIRDARVQLSTQGIRDRKDDFGFVPLLHLYIAYDSWGWRALLVGDGLAGGPGRAFDFFIGGQVPVFSNLDLQAGYRFLEGGADVDEVYNFAMLHFVSVGLGWRF